MLAVSAVSAVIPMTTVAETAAMAVAVTMTVPAALELVFDAAQGRAAKDTETGPASRGPEGKTPLVLRRGLARLAVLVVLAILLIGLTILLVVLTMLLRRILALGIARALLIV